MLGMLRSNRRNAARSAFRTIAEFSVHRKVEDSAEPPPRLDAFKDLKQQLSPVPTIVPERGTSSIQAVAFERRSITHLPSFHVTKKIAFIELIRAK
jgi:hypothetical protein